MKVKNTSPKWIALGLVVAAFAAPPAQAGSPSAPYVHSPGVGTQPAAKAHYVHSPGVGTQPAVKLDTAAIAEPSPVDRILAQERGRALDPRLFAQPASIEIVQSGGFHWGDAGIGAGTAVGLLLLAFGTTLVVRSGRVRSA